MRVILLLLLAAELFSFDSATASKIFDKIFHALIAKEKISVYSVNTTYRDVLANAPGLYLSTDCMEADIVLVDDFNEIPPGELGCEKPLFATSYPVYKRTKSAVGAFYWDRGRIKIEFSKSRLRDHNMTLPENFKKYISDDL